MSDPAPDELARLERENDELRARLGARRTGRLRGGLVVVLVLLGVLLVPPAVVAGWARVTLTDTDRFVAAYAPLARDPAVQGYLVDQVMVAVDDSVGFDQLAQQVVDGVVDLGTGPRATAALRALTGPIAAGLRSAVESTTANLVASSAFANVWEQVLRSSHATVVATLGPDPDTVLTVRDDALVLQLGPVVEAARTQLLARGYTIAERIPTTGRQVVVLEGARVGQAQVGYTAVLLLGVWLAPVSLALLAGGVLLSRRRRVGLVAVGVGLVLVATTMLAALVAGRTLLPGAVPALPRSVLTPAYAAVTDPVAATAQAVLVFGAALALLAWSLGQGRAPVALRAGYRVAAGGLGAGLARVGVPGGPGPGRALPWLRGAVVLAAVAVLALVRPLDVPLVLGIVLLAGLAVLVLDAVALVPAREAAAAGPPRP